MDSSSVTSSASLVIQSSGVVLVALLSFFLTRSIRRTFLDYWTIAWLCLSVSLGCLLIGFNRPSLQSFFYSSYLLLEYAFGFMFLTGCRNYANGARLNRRHLYLLIPAVVVAGAAPQLTRDFNVIFTPHAAIIAGLFATAYFVLAQRRRGAPSPGLRVMSFALILLTLDFLHYVPIFAYSVISGSLPLSYLKYTSIYDLILEILLGFGSVMVVMEDVRREVEAANRDLTAARDRLEILARMDPLTEAFNRHAFCSLVDRNEDAARSEVSGCAVVIDMDNLKPINDSLGHSAGDSAIRAVAGAIRSVIRSYDLLFRWGGDEFLILLFNLTGTEVRARIEGLNAALAGILLPGSRSPVRITVSFGIATFSSMKEIEQAIEHADTNMYAHKHVAKAHRP